MTSIDWGPHRGCTSQAGDQKGTIGARDEIPGRRCRRRRSGSDCLRMGESGRSNSAGSPGGLEVGRDTVGDPVDGHDLRPVSNTLAALEIRVSTAAPGGQFRILVAAQRYPTAGASSRWPSWRPLDPRRRWYPLGGLTARACHLGRPSRSATAEGVRITGIGCAGTCSVRRCCCRGENRLARQPPPPLRPGAGRASSPGGQLAPVGLRRHLEPGGVIL